MIDIIVNPASHGSEGRRTWEKLEAILNGNGWRSGTDYALHETTPGHSAEQIAAELTSDPDRHVFLAVIGGDGTLDETVNGIDPSRPVRLAVLPSGSGNDFARSMKIGSDPARFASQIMAPSAFRRVDIGEVTADDDPSTTRRFIESSGIGYDAAVCFRIASGRVAKVIRVLHLQNAQYTLSGLLEIFRTPPMTGTLTANGKTVRLKNTRFVSAHIHPFEGGGFCFAPDTDPSDGKLDFCVVNRCSKGRFLLMLVMSLFRAHMKLKHIDHVRAEEAELTFTESFPVHRDGELYGHRRKLSYRCLKSELYLMKP